MSGDFGATAAQRVAMARSDADFWKAALNRCAVRNEELERRLGIAERALEEIADVIPGEGAPYWALDGSEGILFTVEQVRREAEDIIERMRARAREALAQRGLSGKRQPSGGEG